jgi:hypothetical protein
MQCDGKLPTFVVSPALKSTLTVQVATRSLSCGDARKGGKFSLLAFPSPDSAPYPEKCL